MSTLSRFDLDCEEAVLLPEREAMSFLNLDLKIAIIDATNVATAINLGGLGSTATAVAGQSITVYQ